MPDSGNPEADGLALLLVALAGLALVSLVLSPEETPPKAAALPFKPGAAPKEAVNARLAA